MRSVVVTLQTARIAALVGLLFATGWHADVRAIRLARMSFDAVLGAWGLWAVGSLLAVGVVAVILVGRRTRHPWAVLAVEGLLAAVLAFTLPLQWMSWFGFNSWAVAMVSGPVQPLAVAWLGVVVAVAAHQIRAPRPQPAAAWTPPSHDDRLGAEAHRPSP